MFILLGAAFWRRPAIPTEPDKASRGSPFVRGLQLRCEPSGSALRILATIHDFSNAGGSILRQRSGFLSGVALGKFAALCGFVMASHLLTARLQQRVAINHLVGMVLLAIGILQWIRLTLL